MTMHQQSGLPAGYFDGSSGGGSSKHFSFGMDGIGRFRFFRAPKYVCVPVVRPITPLSPEPTVRTQFPGRASFMGLGPESWR